MYDIYAHLKKCYSMQDGSAISSRLPSGSTVVSLKDAPARRRILLIWRVIDLRTAVRLRRKVETWTQPGDVQCWIEAAEAHYCCFSCWEKVPDCQCKTAEVYDAHGICPNCGRKLGDCECCSASTDP